MALTTIPARTVKTCDCCGVTMDGTNDLQSGALHIVANVLDVDADRYVDASRNLDLCDECLEGIRVVVENAIKAVKEPN